MTDISSIDVNPPPTVSVLMTAYNAARFVQDAIESVLDQTYPDFEILVVDDGSTDETWAIIDALSQRDARIRAFRQRNEGFAAGMNACLRRARGRYLAILDSDDLMLPERLAMQVAYLDAHPDVSVVGSQWLALTEQGAPCALDRHPVLAEDVAVGMYAHFAMHHPTLMVRHADFVALGEYPVAETNTSGDYELFMRFVQYDHRVVNLPLVLTCWRLNPGGITHGRAQLQTASAEGIRRRAFVRLAEVDPSRADLVAATLVRNAPAGDWFDAKVSRLLPGHPPSAHYERWLDLCRKGLIPPFEAAAVALLHGEPAASERLESTLREDGLDWLANLLHAHAGGEAPPQAVATLSLTEGDTKPDTTLSVLLPYAEEGEGLEERIRLVRSLTRSIETELITFPVTALQRMPQTAADLREVPYAGSTGATWAAALAASRGALLAFAEPGYRPAAGFWTEACERLAASGSLDAVYSPARRCWADATWANGEPCFDPAPEPRWSNSTLLGQDRAVLSGFVMRRATFDRLPLHLPECGEASAALLARYACIRARMEMSSLRGTHTLPALSFQNRIHETLVYRLGTWYLDTGLGQIPAEHAWSKLQIRSTSERAQALEHAFASRQLALHPGNARLVFSFLSLVGGPFSRSRLLDELLLQAPGLLDDRSSRIMSAKRLGYATRRLGLRVLRRLRAPTMENVH